ERPWPAQGPELMPQRASGARERRPPGGAHGRRLPRASGHAQQPRLRHRPQPHLGHRERLDHRRARAGFGHGRHPIVTRERALSRFALVSGFSALLYPSLWLRSFSLFFGGTSTATAVVLAVFMGGLALGSW